MIQYKNVSEADQLVVGFGVVAAGDIIEVEEAFDNPNFELVGQADSPAVDAVVQPQPGAVSQAEPAPAPELEV